MRQVDTDGQTVSATRFSALTGVSRERLRTWERRHGFPEPVRIGSGPRRYPIADAARVVTVRHAVAAGVPLPEAIAAARGATPPATPPAAAFRATVDGAPVPVALISGPEPLRLIWTNAALRAIEGAPMPGEILPTIAAHRTGVTIREHFASALPRAEIEHPPWGGSVAGPGSAAITARSIVYRLATAPDETPLVAIVGVETRGEHEAR
ncbi:MAG: MerR family transcriptional regulator, partial [Solirubrobacterales bacterium]